jgi:hypothetical protein
MTHSLLSEPPRKKIQTASKPPIPPAIKIGGTTSVSSQASGGTASLVHWLTSPALTEQRPPWFFLSSVLSVSSVVNSADFGFIQNP